jgi:signal transduction histidine kinase
MASGHFRVKVELWTILVSAVMEIEIDLPFSPEQLSLLDMHSVLNVLNVVQYELVRLGELIGYHPELDVLCDQTAEVAESLVRHQEALDHLRSIEEFSQTVMESLQTPPLSQCLDRAEGSRDTLANLTGIFEIIKARATEILDRSETPSAWIYQDIAQLRENFNQVFQAIERNSKGGYHIVNNLAAHEEKDYLIQFRMDARNPQLIFMPPVFQDVMRDLLANARKYTVPGGTITAGLLDNGEELRFVVQDNGCGIPTDEIHKVVEFGFRGSNVIGRPTRGGGFGLTKAYYITKTFGGKMWIDSPLENGKGTRIEIRIPYPE